MNGLMMDMPLLISDLIRHADRHHGDTEIVSKRVEGDFHRGDVIAVRRASGEEIGRGLSNYGSAEARLIARKPSSEIARLLGFVGESELIHRDNLVLA